MRAFLLLICFSFVIGCGKKSPHSEAAPVSPPSLSSTSALPAAPPSAPQQSPSQTKPHSLNQKIVQTIKANLKRPAQPPTLSLEEVLRVVQDTHPELAAADARAEQYRFYTSAARKRMFPTVEAEIGFSSSSAIGGLNQNYSVGFVSTLWDGKTKPTINQNVARQMAEEARRDVILQQLQRQVVSGYLSLLRHARQVRVRSSFHDLSQKVYSDVRSSYQLGLATQQMLFEAEAKVREAEVAMIQAEGDRQKACIQVLSLMSQVERTMKCESPKEVLKPVLNIPEDTSAAIRLALERRPEVQIDLALIEAAQQGVNLARADFYPRVQLSSHVGYTDNPFATGAFGQGGGGLERDWAIGVTVRIPLFDWGKNKDALGAARAALAELESSAQATSQRIANSVANDLISLQMAQASVEAASAQFKAAKSSADLALSDFRLGQLTLTALMTQINAQVSAEASVEDAKSLVVETFYNLKNTLGYNLGGE